MEKEIDISIEKFRQGNISLILDSYDDIFSDFDPRPYHEKALSDDFLFECKNAVRDQNEKFFLRLLVPKQKRNYSDEAKIRKRLLEHFHKHFLEKQKEIKQIKKSGIFWFCAGTAIMLLSTYLYLKEGFLNNFFFIISEPAGWFFFWEGLGKIFIVSKEKKPEFTFYKKMSHTEIIFSEY